MPAHDAYKHDPLIPKPKVGLAEIFEALEDKEITLKCKCGRRIEEGETICFHCEDYENHIGE